MSQSQPAILAPIPAHGRFLVFSLRPGASGPAALERVAALRPSDRDVIGLGLPLVAACRAGVPGLRAFPALVGPGVAFPSTQGAVLALLDGDDPGELLLRGMALAAALGPPFGLEEDVQACRYDTGRDLSGYEDGTESPKGEAGERAAIARGGGPGLDGASFVAVQRYRHDLGGFERLTPLERDHVFGRRREDNEEIEDAPEYAHVKRAAQESFDPPAFMVRRSMPYGDLADHGLFFVAYGATLDPFERVLRRMAGLDDGVVDGILRFSRALSGGYYFCPPRAGASLDLRGLATLAPR